MTALRTATRQATGASSPRRSDEARAATMIAVLALIWGNSFLLIKIAGRAYDPAQVTFLRVATGCFTVAVVAAVTRQRLPTSLRTWGHLAVVGALQNAVPWTLFAVGETTTSSVVAGLCNATTPLSTVLFSLALLPGERPTRVRFGGVLIGLVGVCIILGVWHGFGGRAGTGALLCLLAASAYGIGAPYQRRFLSHRSDSVVSLTTAQLLCATAEITLFTAAHSSLRLPASSGPLAAALVLGVLGSGVAYLLYNSIIKLAGAASASLVTYVVPVVSTLLGLAVLGESVHWYQPIGMVVVLTGVAISSGAAHRLWRRLQGHPLDAEHRMRGT